MKTQLLIVLIILFTTEAFSQNMKNFSGTVKDSQTGNLLEDINVFVTEKNTGTITNFSGEFFFFLVEGIYNVSFTGVGYKPENIILDLRDDKIAEIQLTPTGTKKKSDVWMKKKSAVSNEIVLRKHKLKDPS
jgi:hypothetical protein